MRCPNKGFTTFSLHKRGFTLIELLVVISIIAILSVVGFTSFTNVTKGARDAKRKADIDAIAKAYEVKYKDDIGQYTPLDNTAFTSGATPQDPSSSKGDYFNVRDTNNKGFKVCASLENNSSQLCNNADANCYCKESTQGKIPPDTPSSALLGTGATTIGLGPTTCIPSLSQNLIGYWKMDEGSGSTVDDSSVNNQTLALNAAFNWTTGKLSSAIRNPSGAGGSTISDPSLLEGMSSLTISAWVYPTQLSVTDRRIFTKGTHTDTDMSYRLMYQTDWGTPVGCQAAGNCQNGHWLFNIRTDVGQWWIEPASSPSDVDPKINKWHLVTGVYTGTAGILYYDGAQIAINSSPSGTINTNAYPVSIGSSFIGNIDDVRIYNKALSLQEVNALYNGGNGCIYQ